MDLTGGGQDNGTPVRFLTVNGGHLSDSQSQVSWWLNELFLDTNGVLCSRGRLNCRPEGRFQ